MHASHYTRTWKIRLPVEYSLPPRKGYHVYITPITNQTHVRRKSIGKNKTKKMARILYFLSSHAFVRTTTTNSLRIRWCNSSITEHPKRKCLYVRVSDDGLTNNGGGNLTGTTGITRAVSWIPGTYFIICTWYTLVLVYARPCLDSTANVFHIDRPRGWSPPVVK